MKQKLFCFFVLQPPQIPYKWKKSSEDREYDAHELAVCHFYIRNLHVQDAH